MSKIFSISPHRIKIESTNTTRVANTSPTSANKTADLNGFAAMEACNLILQRLKKVAAEELKADENEINFKDEKVFLNETETHLTCKDII